MRETQALCHHLNSLIVLWGGGTEWYVKRENGKWVAEPGNPSDPRPPELSSLDEVYDQWHKWFIERNKPKGNSETGAKNGIDPVDGGDAGHSSHLKSRVTDKTRNKNGQQQAR